MLIWRGVEMEGQWAFSLAKAARAEPANSIGITLCGENIAILGIGTCFFEKIF
jgi:hypothetical protein